MHPRLSESPPLHLTAVHRIQAHVSIRIGISGWRYPGWRGVFYPPGLPQRRELEFAAQLFPSVEINGTFYSLQRPAYFRAWAESTPPDFLFALKGGRFITHMRKLLNVETAVANFFASGVLALGPKLGPILWQFAPANALRRPFRPTLRSLLQAPPPHHRAPPPN